MATVTATPSFSNANGRAPITSPKPPTLANGTHSVATIRTFNVCVPLLRALTYLTNQTLARKEILKSDESCISNPKSEIGNRTGIQTVAYEAVNKLVSMFQKAQSPPREEGRLRYSRSRGGRLQAMFQEHIPRHPLWVTTPSAP